MNQQRYETLPRDLLADGYSIRKQVSGDSMGTTIPDGSIVHIEPVEKRQVKHGDIVYFVNHENKTVVHRVARKFRRAGDAYLQTWGDGCATPDAPVKLNQVYGRVVRYELNGQVNYPNQSMLHYGSLFIRKYGWYYLRRSWWLLVQRQS